MAKKTAKKTARRRSVRRVAAPRRRRSTGSTKMAGAAPLLMAVVGAMVADRYVDKVPVENPKVRYAVAALGAGVLALKGPAQLRPFAMGAAVVCGIKAVAANFPDLLPAPAAGAGSAAASANGRAKAGAQPSLAQPIGRRTWAQQQEIRDAIQREHGIQGYGSGANMSALNGSRAPMQGGGWPEMRGRSLRGVSTWS